tara:strand:+ start:160 stop:387 length:228 start_codon:yes stop_codon:yes gene_type:complete
MKIAVGILAVNLYLGMVDNIVGDYAAVEISNPSGEVTQVEIPVFLFPCDIKEGDQFYTYEIDGVREIRCGEPPPQ